jgi:hypothetical protein
MLLGKAGMYARTLQTKTRRSTSKRWTRRRCIFAAHPQAKDWEKLKRWKRRAQTYKTRLGSHTRHELPCLEVCGNHTMLVSYSTGLHILLVHYPSLTISSTASLNISQPFFKSPWVMLSGGMNRMTSYTDVVRRSMPFSMHRLVMRLAMAFGADKLRTGSWRDWVGDANSIDTISPWPRMSSTYGPTAGFWRSSFKNTKSSLDLQRQ